MRKYNKYRFDEIKNKLATAGFNPLDVMVTGITGAGKSSTLNVLFEKNIANVGESVEPETMNINSYSFSDGGIRFWDTPGLGDGIEADARHNKEIAELLRKSYGNNNEYGFIDISLVILDAGSKDLGTTYKLINEILLPEFQQSNRVIVALNQCDMALKGIGWNITENTPNKELINFMNEKINSIKRRIHESTNISVTPVYYSAKYNYNIEALLDLIIERIPKQRRVL